MRQRVFAQLARKITGNDLVAGALGVYTSFDGIAGVPLKNGRGEFAHLVGIRVVVAALLDTTNTMTSAAPGAIARAILLNIMIRAGGIDLIAPGMDGESLTLLQDAIHGFRLAPDPISIPDATTANVAETVTVDLRFDDLTGAFGRENDCGIPLGAFSTARDKEHGLRFDFIAAAALVKALTGVQYDTAGVITSARVYGLFRYSRDLNLKSPTRFKQYSEARATFSTDLPGRGAYRALFIADPPAIGTGLRDAVGYTDISLDFDGEQVYSGRSAVELAEMANLTRMSPAQRLLDIDSTAATAVVSGPVGAAAAVQRSGGLINTVAPEIVALLALPPGVSRKDLPAGRANVTIGTRATSAEQVHLAWEPDPDPQYAENVWAAYGLPGKPRMEIHGVNGAGDLKSASRLPIAGKAGGK